MINYHLEELNKGNVKKLNTHFVAFSDIDLLVGLQWVCDQRALQEIIFNKYEDPVRFRCISYTDNPSSICRTKKLLG